MKSLHILLVSEQLLPNLIPALMNPPARAYLVSTRQMRENGQLARLGNLLRERGIGVEEFPDVPSSNLPEIRECATELATLVSDQATQRQLVLNVTGGTKLLAMGFAEVFREVLEGYPLEIIYTDTANQRLETLVPRNRSPRPLSDVLDVRTYLAAQGMVYRTAESDDEHWRLRAETRKQAAKHLGRDSDKLDSLIGALNMRMHGASHKEGALSADGANLINPEQIFERAPNRRWAEALTKCAECGLIEWSGERNFRVADAESARFLGGLWLEEYAWHCAKDSGLHDPRCNVEVTWEGTPKRVAARNEFDLLATHNNQMLVIECKTRKWDDEDRRDADQLTKLESLARHAGGLFGSPLLLSARSLNESARGRCRSLGIALLQTGEIKFLHKTLSAWKETAQLTPA